MVTMTSSADETSAGLMRLAADGDEVAFARIVDAHHADMSSVCFVVTGGDVELTEEAVQSAWPIAWRKLAHDPRSRAPSAVAHLDRRQRGPAAGAPSASWSGARDLGRPRSDRRRHRIPAPMPATSTFATRWRV